MTLYITPMGRITRRIWSQPYVWKENAPAAESEVHIPVNVKADTDNYVLTALVPGVKAEDLSIQVINETITIQGELKDDAAEKDHYLLRERPTGRFTRVIRLPEELNAAGAEADLTDGVLTLRIPKAEEARPRMIKVTTHAN